MQIRRTIPLALLCLAPATACNPGNGDLIDSNESQQSIQSNEGIARRAEETALRHLLEENPALIAGVEEIWTKRVHVEGSGEAHTRLIQTVSGIPVFGGEAIVHHNADGSFRKLTDNFIRNIKVDTRAKIDDFSAADLAVGATGGWSKVTGTPVADLQILRHGGVDRLTYRVKIDQLEDASAPAAPVVFIDAHSGEIVWQYNDLHTSRNRRTHTANNGTSLPGTLVRSEGQAAVSDQVLNAAHDNAGRTYDFYFSQYGRDSYDNNGATLTSTVHYSSNYVNAFWNGTQMVYGDGDGSQSGPLTVLDVVAHELTHAVTDFSSDLIYSNESGALNEAMSDIFGASIEAYRDGAVSGNTWKIGEECWTPGTAGDALRYMNDPATAGDYDYYPTRYTGSSDNGGVHWNSGIANLAFYLMVEGGSHPRGKTSTVVTPLDADKYQSILKGAAIFYRANTVGLTASSTFADARTATVNAASTLYGSAAAASVGSAWDAVGVLPPPDYQVIDTKTNLGGASGTTQTYTYVTSAGTSAIKFVIAGGTGDADLYVKFGSAPTTTSYDCRPYLSGNNETCEFNPAQQGTYYVMIRAYTAFAGANLTVSQAGGTSTPAEVCNDGVDNDSDGAVDCADSTCATDPVCQGPAETAHIGDLDGTSNLTSSNRWRATVLITVESTSGNPVVGATVSGSWSGGATGTASCVTDAGGQCTVNSPNIRTTRNSTTFTVSNVSSSLTYDSSANTDPDGESNGTALTVFRP